MRNATPKDLLAARPRTAPPPRGTIPTKGPLHSTSPRVLNIERHSEAHPAHVNNRQHHHPQSNNRLV